MTQIFKRLEVCSKRSRPKKVKVEKTKDDEDYAVETEVEEDDLFDSGYPPDESDMPKTPLRKKRVRTKRAAKESEMINCTKCPRQFCTPSALRAHMKGHGSDAPMLCELCGFSTKHFASMNMHRRSHDESRQYKCTWPGCTWWTVRETRLTDHLNSHSGIRNHVCTTCGKAYTSRKHLNRHEQTHNEAKLVRCEECNYESTRKDKLRDHIKRHHPGTAIIRGFMHPDDLNRPKPPPRKRPPRVRKSRAKKPKPMVEDFGGAINLSDQGIIGEVSRDEPFNDVARNQQENQMQQEARVAVEQIQNLRPGDPSTHRALHLTTHSIPGQNHSQIISEDMLQFLQSSSGAVGHVPTGVQGQSEGLQFGSAALGNTQGIVLNPRTNTQPGQQWFVMQYPQ